MSAWVAALCAAAAVGLLLPAPAMTRRRTGAVVVPSRPSRPSWADALGRRSRDAADQAAVLEVCDLLAADLAAGRPPDLALTAASHRWPPLVTVVEAMRLGADVPEAMRRLSSARRGARDLRWVAGAWQVAHDSGHGLAAALERTFDASNDREPGNRIASGAPPEAPIRAGRPHA